MMMMMMMIIIIIMKAQREAVEYRYQVRPPK